MHTTNKDAKNNRLSKKQFNSRISPKIRKKRSSIENSDVLVSAVISPYLLTHLHNILQRAEYIAAKEGRISQSANFAQLRKVLCMDARSMEDSCAFGFSDLEKEFIDHQNEEPNVA